MEELARELGVDLGDERIRRMLRLGTLTIQECSQVTLVSRSAIRQAITRKRLKAQRIPHGERAFYKVRPVDLLAWCAARPEPWRYVDRQRAGVNEVGLDR